MDTVRLIIKVTYPTGGEGWLTYDIADQGLYDLVGNWATGTSATVVGSELMREDQFNEGVPDGKRN